MSAYLKNQLRFGKVPRIENGKWDYDSNIMMLDQETKVRGWPGGKMSYDFETVRKMDAQYQQAKIDHPDKELIEPPMTVEKFRGILFDATKYVIENPVEPVKKD